MKLSVRATSPTSSSVPGWRVLQAALDSALSGDVTPLVSTPLDGAADDLVVRWHQAACLLPGCPAPPDVTTHESAVAGLLVRLAVQLRRRFSLYDHTNHALLREYGWPLLQRDTTSVTEPTYRVGASLLVAPIVAPHVAHRAVALPSGVWYDFWTDARHVGDRRIVAPAPLERLPLYVSGGAVLPLASEAGVRLRVFIGDGENTLYEDSGRPNDAADGNFRWVYITCRRDGDTFRLTRRVAGRYTPESARLTVEVIGMNALPADVLVDRRGAPLWYFEQGRLELPVADDFSELELHFGS